MEEELKRYIKTFKEEDSIVKKYDHSVRVERISKILAENLNLSKREIDIASVVGLLHDFGRFYQWDKYKTFNDRISVDHADYGVKMLFENKQIKKFYNNKEDYDIIYDAIKYHNKYIIPSSVKNTIQCQIIRDADKIDLLYMYSIKIFKIEEHEIISKIIKEDFYNHKLLKNEDKLTSSDYFIGTLSFIYDLYLQPSFDYIKKEKILDNIYNLIEDKRKFKPYFDEIYNYMDKNGR